MMKLLVFIGLCVGCVCGFDWRTKLTDGMSWLGWSMVLLGGA